MSPGIRHDTQVAVTNPGMGAAGESQLLIFFPISIMVVRYVQLDQDIARSWLWQVLLDHFD